MNCLYAAKRIGGEALSIPQLMKQDNFELSDDAVGIVCPVWNTRRNHLAGGCTCAGRPGRRCRHPMALVLRVGIQSGTESFYKADESTPPRSTVWE